MKKLGIIEIIMIVAIMIVTVVFAVKTITSAPSIKECQKVAQSIETLENTINNPTQWVIESVSEDYSKCEVTHGDGWTYTHMIYKCYHQDNYLVVILKWKGELHEFTYFE